MIYTNIVKVDERLRSNQLPPPEDGPVDVTIKSEEVRKARKAALNSNLELHNLLLGPAETGGKSAFRLSSKSSIKIAFS